MKNNGIMRLFYKGKHIKKTNTDNIIAMVLPSVLGIILCAVCLMGSTWAWFTATQSTGTQTIQARNYTVSVQVNGSSLNTPTTLENGEYTVMLTAGGDATTGYCKVKLGNSEKLTQQFPPEKSFTFTLVLNETTMVEFIPCCGTSIEDERIQNQGSFVYGKVSDSVGELSEKDDVQPADTTEEATSAETDSTAEEPTHITAAPKETSSAKN